MARRPIDFASLRCHLAPIRVLRLHGWIHTDYAGGQWRGPCLTPGCSSQQSRVMGVSDRVVYCHRCKMTCDALGVHMRYTGLPCYEAAVDLCERFSLPIPFLG